MIGFSHGAFVNMKHETTTPLFMMHKVLSNTLTAPILFVEHGDNLAHEINCSI